MGITFTKRGVGKHLNSFLDSFLEALGLDSLHYHIHLSETIFDLFGFPNNKTTDKIFEYYLTELKKASHLNIRSNREAFDALASSIYNKLQKRKSTTSK